MHTARRRLLGTSATYLTSPARGLRVVLTLASLSAGTLGACSSADKPRGAAQVSSIGQTQDELETAKIQALLDSRYVAADVRHSFKTKFGETIDCIDFFAQKGVKRLAERGFPITQLPPRPARTVPLPDDVFNGAPDENGAARECPEGAVPILRTTVADVKAAGGLEAMRRRPHPLPPAGTCPLSDLKDDLVGFGHVIENYPTPGTSLQHITAGTANMNILQPAVPTVVTESDGGTFFGFSQINVYASGKVGLVDYQRPTPKPPQKYFERAPVSPAIAQPQPEIILFPLGR